MGIPSVFFASRKTANSYGYVTYRFLAGGVVYVKAGPRKRISRPPRLPCNVPKVGQTRGVGVGSFSPGTTHGAGGPRVRPGSLLIVTVAKYVRNS